MEPKVLSANLRDEALERVAAAIEKANKVLKIQAKMIEVRFDLKSKSICGQFKLRFGQVWLRFHPVYLFENQDDYLNDTIQHEVAHYIDWHLREIEKKKPDYKNRKLGHGPTWRRIMREVYNIDPKKSRFHSYDSSSIETFAMRGKRIRVSKVTRLTDHILRYTRRWDERMKQELRYNLESHGII